MTRYDPSRHFRRTRPDSTAADLTAQDRARCPSSSRRARASSRQEQMQALGGLARTNRECLASNSPTSGTPQQEVSRSQSQDEAGNLIISVVVDDIGASWTPLAVARQGVRRAEGCLMPVSPVWPSYAADHRIRPDRREAIPLSQGRRSTTARSGSSRNSPPHGIPNRCRSGSTMPPFSSSTAGAGCRETKEIVYRCARDGRWRLSRIRGGYGGVSARQIGTMVTGMRWEVRLVMESRRIPQLGAPLPIYWVVDDTLWEMLGWLWDTYDPSTVFS